MKTPENNISSTATPQTQTERQPFFGKEGHDPFFSKSGRATGSFFGPATIQPKLTVGQPNDKYEVEADAMADRVVQKLSQPANHSPLEGGQGGVHGGSLIQTKCAECEEEEKLQKKEDILADGISHIQQKPIFESDAEQSEQEIQTKPKIQAKCDQCEEEEQLQAKTDDPSLNAPSGIESKLNANKGSGNPLSPDIQNSMSSAFGTDFSSVRVHTGANAVQMNKELGAQAFTHGSDIYFNEGKYDTNSTSGKHLLAHELTHTVQQNSGPDQKKVQKAIDYNGAKIHTDQQAKELTEERMADAVTIKNDIYIHPDQIDSNHGIDQGLLNHELTHVKQQQKYSNTDISNIDTYMNLEKEAVHNESSPPQIQKQNSNSSEGSFEDRETRRLNRFKGIAEEELGMMQRVAFISANINTLAEYDAFMKKKAVSDAAYVKSKLLENWVDDDDELSILRQLKRWAKIPKPEGGNYLDLVLDYLRERSLHMNYFISESVSVTYLDQLYEEMEGIHKPILYAIIDTYSIKYSGYRGRGGVSMFGSFSNSMMSSRIKRKISTLNRKISGLKTIPMTENEIRRSNELYSEIRLKTFGLVDLPRITVNASKGQNVAPAIAIPVITIGMILEALLIALLVVLVIALILELLEIIERAIDRIKEEIRRRRRPQCRVFPLGYHRGGNTRHDNCADTIPPNIHPGSDVEVENPNIGVRKSFDALDPTRGLWEVKTNNYSSYPDFIKNATITSNLADVAHEFPLATSCGYLYYFGVTDSQHYTDLLARVPPGVNVRLMNC